MTHKHVELVNTFIQHLPDDDGHLREVAATQKAVMDVPEEDLEAFLADARARWVNVTVTDTCPQECVAQLAGGQA